MQKSDELKNRLLELTEQRTRIDQAIAQLEYALGRDHGGQTPCGGIRRLARCERKISRRARWRDQDTRIKTS